MRNKLGAMGPGTILLCLIGCSGATPEHLSIGAATHVVLFEGLPHSFYEATAFQSETAGTTPTIELAGYPFYRDSLTLSATDQAALVEILGNRGSYEAFAGEKKCGGFHPDYAVEWLDGAVTRRTLICFTCGEVKVAGANSSHRYDLSKPAQTSLHKILSSHRRHRPPATVPIG